MTDDALRRALFWVARIEGVSLLFLFFVAMPLKYGAGLPIFVEIAGWAHGLLFLAFTAALVVGWLRLGWRVSSVGAGFAASFLPFGTFLWERWMDEPGR